MGEEIAASKEGRRRSYDCKIRKRKKILKEIEQLQLEDEEWEEMEIKTTKRRNEISKLIQEHKDELNKLQEEEERRIKEEKEKEEEESQQIMNENFTTTSSAATTT